MPTPREDQDELEAMVDRHGLTKVLQFLEAVCHDKEEHLQVNWQDGTSAKAWRLDARTLEQAARKICSDA